MKMNKTIAKKFLLFATVTGSVLAAAPSLAATFALSKGSFDFRNFSTDPLEVVTMSEADTFVISTGGEVIVEANAESNFNPDSPDPLQRARNKSLSTAEGEGSNYRGIAESFAGLIGYNFFVDAGETFSFDFNGFLDLITMIDNPPAESASAEGTVVFELYDTNDLSTPIDFFALSGNLETLGYDDFLVSAHSDNVFAYNDFTKLFGGTEEFALADVQGYYERTFETATYLTLVEAKTNKVTVKAPESSNLLGLLFFGLLSIGYRVKTKSFTDKSKLLRD
ncbi:MULTISPECIES: hypothetical protein [Moorena]|uniref:PEP-CTERM sorting domain-containing protein n=2 Tax=Moorena TaxID=1155738 RepID=F4XKI0_9CYAN|nr:MULTISPECIES: hypothetical protein [Moorena]EGJ34835.1 hypothetical protein LYNGBM3L_08870 [Moorena producens 3L]NER86555.1 hypothetical protein [Moorena sp. SIO3A2]NES41640.1 hypothetical protein [Moorena sp. SIO2C4]